MRKILLPLMLLVLVCRVWAADARPKTPTVPAAGLSAETKLSLALAQRDAVAAQSDLNQAQTIFKEKVESLQKSVAAAQEECSSRGMELDAKTVDCIAKSASSGGSAGAGAR